MDIIYFLILYMVFSALVSFSLIVDDEYKWHENIGIMVMCILLGWLIFPIALGQHLKN